MAINLVGNGLYNVKQYKDALSVREATLSLVQRIGTTENNILGVQGNLANLYGRLGRHESALRIKREIYARRVELYGATDEDSLLAAGNLASTLVEDLEQFDETRAFLQDRIPEAIGALGKNHDLTFKLQRMHAQCLFENAGASLEDVTAAIAALEDLDRRMTRIFGAAHPQTDTTRFFLEEAREKLARAK